MANQHQEQPMTLEQIEAHIQKANLEQYQQTHDAGVAAKGIDLGAQLKKVCGVYKGIRPVLQVITNFPLIPGSIKNAVKTFMSVMDPICPA